MKFVMIWIEIFGNIDTDNRKFRKKNLSDDESFHAGCYQSDDKDICCINFVSKTGQTRNAA